MPANTSKTAQSGGEALLSLSRRQNLLNTLPLEFRKSLCLMEEREKPLESCNQLDEKQKDPRPASR
jgi:hypothetical protein